MSLLDLLNQCDGSQAGYLTGAGISPLASKMRPQTSLAEYLETSMGPDTWEGKMRYNETRYLFGDHEGV